MSKSDAFFNPDQYATVAERIELFYSRFPEGRINTELVTRENGEITFKALVYRTAAETLAATGWASEREGDGDVNTVACLENTETSAVGRALANLGFTASSKRPSREEMEKAMRVRRALSFRDAKPRDAANSQSAADALDDVLHLLSKAQTKQPGLPQSRLEKIETALRSWIRRREV